MRCGLGRETVEALRACEKRPLVSRVLMDSLSLFMHGAWEWLLLLRERRGCWGCGKIYKQKEKAGFKARNFVRFAFGEDFIQVGGNIIN